MVMPEEGGKAGTLAITFPDGAEETLHGDYSAMAVAGAKKQTYIGDPEVLQQTFGAAVLALPKPPMSAYLFFLRGKDELTARSRRDAEKIFREFVDRQYPEVWIIGHTDTVGSNAYNEALSIRRAEKVRQALVRLGVPAENIVAKGTGKRDLPIQTPDNTDEPRNRQVEISVR